MKILSIDTSSKNCSVSITQIDDNTNDVNNLKIISSKNNDDEETHSQKLMPMISEMFDETNLSLDDISLLVSCIGPRIFYRD